jgi:superfamily II DNA or RNA helicase
MFTDIVSTITMKQAIEAGYLAKPLVIVPDELYRRINVPVDDLDTRAGLEKQAATLGETAIIGDVIGQYARVFGGLPVLVACSTYAHARDMAAAFSHAGWKFEHIHSNLPTAERRRMLRQIRTGELHGLCTVGIGIEAVDIPGLYGLMWLRRTLSVTIYLQFIGRVLRPLTGKVYGIILDPVGNLFIHGFPESHRVWTLDGDTPDRTANPDTPTMRICPRCGVANAVGNAQCHMCGLDFSSEEAHSIRERRLPAMIDGKLVAITSDGMEAELSAVRDAAKASEDVEAVESAQPLTRLERIDFLQKGLFAGARSELMREALEEWRR